MYIRNFNSINRKHILTELNSLKTCDHKLLGSKFNLIFPQKLQDEIKNFNIKELKSILKTINENEEYYSSDFEIDSDHFNNDLDQSVLTLTLSEICPNVVRPDDLKVISDYIPEIEEENIVNLVDTQHVTKIVTHNENDNSSIGFVKTLVNNFIKMDTEDNIENTVENTVENKNNAGYCTIM